MILEDCRIISNSMLAETVGRLVLHAPQIAPLVKPGQFVHLQIPQHGEHILRRPFSVYDVSGDKTELSIIYQIVGRGTEIIARLTPNIEVSLLGPIGNGWSVPSDTDKALLIGGGIGAAPLMLLAKQLAKVTLVIGAANASMLVFDEDYTKIVDSDRIHICTDDGSAGVKGFTTDVATDLLSTDDYDYIASCGPEPMQVRVAQIAQQFNTPCQVSLEKRMACGIGACLSCVVQTTAGQKRACVDGPVFNANEVIW